MVKKNKNNDLVILPHILGIFTGFLGPLIVLLLADGDLKTHSKKAFNWQLSALIYTVFCFILMVIFVGFLLLSILWFLNIVFCVMAAIKASNGEVWDYPMSIKFLK